MPHTAPPFFLPSPDEAAPSQTPQEAEARYHVNAWGNGYFFVNSAGHVAVRPRADSEASIDLHEAVAHLRSEGVSFPAVLRFPDLLSTRVRRLHEAFASAIDALGYEGVYRGVYPIKVNQLSPVVEALLEAGRPYHLGLECGSRAELAAALPYVEGEALLICNGCKDGQMMRLMAEAQRVGKRALPVLERADEYSLLRRAADQTGATAETPLRFGARVRLSTSGTGLWSESSGVHSKFGLSLTELLHLADALAGQEELRFELLHFHLGSQIADLESVHDAATEAARLYAALRQHGLPLHLLDIGGGLGVPYEADNPEADGWVGYTLDGYTRAIVEAVREVCDAEHVPHPTLVSESGRALTAYHAVFVTDVIGTRAKRVATEHREAREADDTQASSDLARIQDRLRTPVEANGGPLSDETLRALHERAEHARLQAAAGFRSGALTLKEKARVEQRYGAVCYALGRHAARSASARKSSAALRSLSAHAADHYLCNFSIFQSIPDHWALGQRFPIMPLGRLSEAPTRHATLIDLTCDSDGAVVDFVTPEGQRSFLEVHPLRDGEPYALGLFLVGAYQDTLGDMHNLFGHPSDVSLRLDPSAPAGFRVEMQRPPTRVSEQLAEVRYDATTLQERLQAYTERAISNAQCTLSQAAAFHEAYGATLEHPTYLAP